MYRLVNWKYLKPPARLTTTEVESIRRLRTLLVQNPDAGQYYLTYHERVWYAVWGMGLFIVYRPLHHKQEIFIAYIGRWAGPEEESGE